MIADPPVLPVAVDAMGGDHAPDAIVAGAAEAAHVYGVPVLLVGRPDRIADPHGLEVYPCTEEVGMHEDGARAVRRKKDSSMVVAAELVRDGRASAMLSAGNTGATVTAALLRMGRIRGVSRPAIATPIPVPGAGHTVLLDSGANPAVQPAWLVQFAQMGSAYATARFGIEEPRVGLLNIGEEPSKGTDLTRAAYDLLSAAPGITFVGNVEGRDLLSDWADVVVTDGFTGNVALKTLEGGVKFVRDAVLRAFASSDEAVTASETLLPLLVPLATELDPDSFGGAMTLGVDGVCVISHGSSGQRAITNAVRTAYDMACLDLVGRLAKAVGAPSAGSGT
ncbi:MAG: phosphate acyltransferase PlsX [Acidimicrobiales bacterium]